MRRTFGIDWRLSFLVSTRDKTIYDFAAIRLRGILAGDKIVRNQNRIAKIDGNVQHMWHDIINALSSQASHQTIQPTKHRYNFNEILNMNFLRMGYPKFRPIKSFAIQKIGCKVIHHLVWNQFRVSSQTIPRKIQLNAIHRAIEFLAHISMSCDIK